MEKKFKTKDEYKHYHRSLIKKHILQVRLDELSMERIDQISLRERRSRADLIRDAIFQYIDRKFDDLT
ncbi:ribbon-helix-helix domain-containing protein [Flavobacterium sp.]|jgi:metal-responsive CopG/Arc/MetJ family transcriptional regulator|uniref:CopG family ribbon-helix-helix protein n=1 Tax=Flavobacterium sp. TaxID=239 RepID=UPI0025F50F15|nr:ribbon-helix-helix domain-containing protein [Flavobacterium sp.]